jgi:uncharacterized protein YegP (UPF0339 family)
MKVPISKKGSLEHERKMIRNIHALAVLAALSLSAAACAAPTEEESVGAEETSQDLVSRSAFFETFQGLDESYYFHLMAGNGQNVLRSQGYTRLASAEGGAASVLANGNDKRNFELLEASNGDWYFNLKAANGETIGTSQLYATKYDAERGEVTVRALVRLARAQTQTTTAPRVVQFEVFEGEDRQDYFRLRAGNGEILLGSEGYASASNAKRAIDSVITNGSDEASYEVFETGGGQWGVHLVAGNGQIIARAETYASKSNADRAVARMAEILRGRVSINE